MSHPPLKALHFPMVDLFTLRRSMPGATLTFTSRLDLVLPSQFGLAYRPDAVPAVNTRSTFAELAVELGLREVES